MRRPPDLVIADYHLADGTGVEAIRHLRQHFEYRYSGLARHCRQDTGGARRGGEAWHCRSAQAGAAWRHLRAYITQISGLKRAAAE